MTPRTTHGGNSHHRSSAKRPNPMRELRAHAATITEEARDLAASAGDALLGRIDPIRRAIEEKPLQSVLIAGGVGLLLGFLYRRR